MLSTVESSDELRERVRAADRAAAAPYVDYPATPWWYHGFFGLWSVAFVLVMRVAADPVWRPVGLVLLCVAVGLLSGWQRRRRGTWPRGKAPAEIQRAMLGFVVGAVAVIALGALLLWLAPVWAAAAVLFVVVTAGVWSYERAYDRAAARTRARLGAAA